eukprot:7271996-Ditylum_brightwellii.AAC.2
MLVGSGIPKPALFTLCPHSSLSPTISPGSSSPNRAGKKCLLRASSIGPMCWPTPGTVRWRYCHSCCRLMASPAYAVCGYLQANPAKIWTPFAHASTCGLTHASSSSSLPTKPPTYLYLPWYFSLRPSASKTAFVASRSAGLLQMWINLAGLGK